MRIFAILVKFVFCLQTKKGWKECLDTHGHMQKKNKTNKTTNVDVHQVWSQSERVTLEFIQKIQRDRDLSAVINKSDAKDEAALAKLKTYLHSQLMQKSDKGFKN